MNSELRVPIVAVVVATAVTAALNAVGMSDMSFACLLPLALLFWAIRRVPLRAMGFSFGSWAHYGLAILHPVSVLTGIGLVCLATGAVDLSQTDWRKVQEEFLSAAIMSLVLGLLTEELFFRGWLFGVLQRAGLSGPRVVVWTAIAFSAWHIPAVVMDTQDALPLAQIPVLLVNGVVVGCIWGGLRLVSGSILVTSVCHALWNAAVYALFGFGTTVGALGVTQTLIYGPESGILGLVMNLVLAALLWRWWRRRQHSAAVR
jgi:membrane protease YdiL (CAAX protease family)